MNNKNSVLSMILSNLFVLIFLYILWIIEKGLKIDRIKNLNIDSFKKI